MISSKLKFSKYIFGVHLYATYICVMDLKEPKDVRSEISDHLKERGIAIAWLAKQLYVSRQYMNDVLKCRKELSDERLEQINLLLETDFKKEKGKNLFKD